MHRYLVLSAYLQNSEINFPGNFIYNVNYGYNKIKNKHC